MYELCINVDVRSVCYGKALDITIAYHYRYDLRVAWAVIFIRGGGGRVILSEVNSSLISNENHCRRLIKEFYEKNFNQLVVIIATQEQRHK